MENTNPLVVVRHGLEWQQDAACRGEMAAAFYPPLRPEKKHERLARERAAKAVCDTCTVRVECLALVELAYDSIASREDRAETRKLLAGTALALRRYRLRHGSYPATLAALSSAEPPASPIDPFTGRPLGFRRQGAGFVLRSAGVEPADRSLRWEIPR